MGDIVSVAEQPAGSARRKEVKGLEAKGARGVVVRVQRGSVGVALDREEEEEVHEGGKLWVVKLANDVTYKRSVAPFAKLVWAGGGGGCSGGADGWGFRMNQVMSRMEKMKEQEYSSFLRVLFGLESPTLVPEMLDYQETEANGIEWVDGSLNDSQKDAVRFALASREVALIHGPPGVSYSASCHFIFMLIDLIMFKDWQDSYHNRTYLADAQARTTSISLWTI